MAIHYLIKKANEFETICGDNLRELRYTFLTVTSNSMEIGKIYIKHIQNETPKEICGEEICGFIRYCCHQHEGSKT